MQEKNRLSMIRLKKLKISKWEKTFLLIMQLKLKTSTKNWLNNRKLISNEGSPTAKRFCD